MSPSLTVVQDLQSTTTSCRKLSTQMRAVLLIFEADPYLQEMVMPHVDLANESIYWPPILKFPFGSGHRAAITFAYSVWTDEVRPKANPFASALSMSPSLQQACLKALAMRWGLLR